MAAPDDEARNYLKAAFKAGRIEKKAASLAVGKGHSYFHEYFVKRKPRWLDEPTRQALVSLYGIDGDQLRPPPVKLRDGVQQAQVDPPSDGKLTDDPRTLELLEVWKAIPDGQRDLAIRILKGFAGDAATVVA